MDQQPTIRLDQFLKAHSLAETGGQAKLLIQDGLVRVNGEVETRRRTQLRHGDVVQLGADQVLVEFQSGESANSDLA